MFENINNNLPLIAIVVPCFNEEKVIPEAAIKLEAVLNDASYSKLICEKSFIVFVDDGSLDQTWDIIKKLNQQSPIFHGLKLSRNFGHQNALWAGLEFVNSFNIDCCISIDADLQQDETVIPQFIQKFYQGAEIVYGIRQDRESDNFFKKKTAELFYFLMRALGTEVIKNHADFRLLGKKALKALLEYGEYNLFLRGIVSQLGFKKESVYFNVKPRFAGETKYSTKKMLKFAVNGITSFSSLPLYMVSAIGAVVCFSALIMSFYILIIRFFFNTAVPGWASTVLPVYFIGGINIFCTGIIGVYMAKMYMELKGRPRYILDSKV